MNNPAAARFQNLTPFSATLLLIAATSLIHLLVAGRIELSGDEAHYALYGALLDWSYFDHPPLVGWLNAIVLLFSDSDFALRVLPNVMFAASSLVLYQLTRELFGTDKPWLGFISVTIMQSGFMFHMIALAMLPDSPLLLLGLLALLMLWHAVNTGQFRYWVYLGICFGLAGLSKYTAVTLVATALLFTHFSHRWSVLRTPGPWVALLIALLLISPVIYWNAINNWISFNYQLDHGFRNPEWRIDRFVITQLLQIIVYSPGIYILGLCALVASFRHWQHPGIRLLILFTLPILLLFNWGSGYEVSLPHWTALAWAGIAPLTAFWLTNNWQKKWLRVSTWSSLTYSTVLILTLNSLLFYPWLNLPEENNFLRDFHGWKDATARAQELADEMAREPGDKPYLMVNNWSRASRIAWYGYPEKLIVVDGRFDQFDIWYGGPDNVGRGIMVIPTNADHPPTLKTRTHACEQIDSQAAKHHGHTQVTYYFYACQPLQ